MDTTPKSSLVTDNQSPASQWLRDAATRHDGAGDSVWATLYRNEAMRLENPGLYVLGKGFLR